MLLVPLLPEPQVTICYLGRPQLLPFNKRIAILADDYGFECSCPRCVVSDWAGSEDEAAYGCTA